MFAIKFPLVAPLKSLLALQLALFISCLPLRAEVLAESLQYCGLTLNFDTIKAVDGDNVLVAIGSDQKIITRASLEHWAVEKLILESNHLSKLPIQQLSAFVNQCYDSEASLLIVVALAEILKRGDLDSFSPKDFISRSNLARDIFKKTLENEIWETVVRDGRAASQITLISEAIAELIVTDPQWVRARALRLFYLLSKPVSTYLFQKIKEELASENITYLSALGNSIALFGDDRSKDIYLLQLAAVLSQKLLRMTFDFESMKSVISGAENSDVLMDLLYPNISAQLTTQISTLFKQDKFLEALNVASLFVPSRRTPESVAVVLQLLSDLKLKPEVQISEKHYQIFQAYTLADSTLAAPYMNLLNSQFIRQIESAQFKEVEQTLSRIVAVRFDPNIDNDELRFKLALAYSQHAMPKESSNQIAQIKTGVGIYQSLQLFMAGGLWNVFILIFILLLASSLLIWLLNKIGFLKAACEKFSDIFDFLFSLVSSNGEARSHKIKENIDSESEARAAAFVRLDRMRAVSPAQVEYEKKLSLFKLNRKASLKEIKTAYRTAVKECHPDLNPNQSKAQTERFSELTKAYEELIELRKELGLLD